MGLLSGQLLVDVLVRPRPIRNSYLCSAFQNIPNTGIDSKVETFVHGASHFTLNSGTSDYAYGQSYTKGLATSSPSRDISSADSHEYFTENESTLSLYQSQLLGCFVENGLGKNLRNPLSACEHI